MNSSLLDPEFGGPIREDFENDKYYYQSKNCKLSKIDVINISASMVLFILVMTLFGLYSNSSINEYKTVLLYNSNYLILFKIFNNNY